MTDADVQSKWSPWKDQYPPPYGPDAEKLFSADVRLAMSEATYAAHRVSHDRLWDELYAVMAVPVLEQSNTELVANVRMTLGSLRNRIDELEGRLGSVTSV